MQIERISVTGAEVLAIQGQLDATTAAQLEGALEDAADYGGGQPLVVDLAGVGLISSAALRVLLSAAKRARKESGKIHLCAANTEVRKVFEISGLAALFDLHDTREDALTATGASTAAMPAPPALSQAEQPTEAIPAIHPEPTPVAEEIPWPPATPEPAPLEPNAFAATIAEPATPAEEKSSFPPPPAPPLFVPMEVEPVAVAPAPVAPPFPEMPAAFAPPPPPPPPQFPSPVEPLPVAPEPFVPPIPLVTVSAAPPPPVPPPARNFAKPAGAPPPPAPARVPSRASSPGTIPGAKRPFPLFPILAGVLVLGLAAAAAAYFLFNKFAPKTGLAEVTPAPTAAPAETPTPSPEPSILPMDTPTPAPTAAPSASDSSPTPTPTPALVGASPSATPSLATSGGNTGPEGEANRVAAPSQINFDPSDPRNAAVRESVLKRIESMPVSRKVKDQLYAALERARGMGRVATITFGSGRTDLTPADIESLRKGLAQPVTARLKADPTVVIVILGYADTKGDAAANRKLSEQRAARTMDALKGPCGLLNIMHSVGMGPSELLDGKNADANRAVEVWAVQP